MMPELISRALLTMSSGSRTCKLSQFGHAPHVARQGGNPEYIKTICVVCIYNYACKADSTGTVGPETLALCSLQGHICLTLYRSRIKP